MKKTALLPGSFDPPSYGHVDIIQRASQICDKLFVAVAINRNKTKEMFSTEEKLKLLKEVVKSAPNVEIITFDGLVVDFAKANHVNFLIRGLRAFSDFEYEFQMAMANRKIGNIETVFLMAAPELSYVSSTLIREVASFGRRLHEFVPAEIEPFVFERLKSKNS